MLKTDTKASRAKYACPKQLETFLKMLRWIEPTKNLENFEDVNKEIRESNPLLSDFEVIQAALERCLISNELKKYIEDIAVGEDLLDRVTKQIGHYEEFRFSRLKLSRLIDQKNRFGSKHAINSINEDYDDASALRVDAKGIIRVFSDLFTKAIHGTELNRIRKCEVCGHIFWAKRDDSKTCSAQHGDIRRKRLSRENKNKKKEESNGNL